MASHTTPGTNTHKPYRGRFAPSPTGTVHLGTLVTAVASYLQALAHHGEWLLRIEDVDTLRIVPGAADNIIRTLEDFGFRWSGEILYQTQRTQAYQAALDYIHEQNLVFACHCSRATLTQSAVAGPYGLIYPGTCRHSKIYSGEDAALRIIAEDVHIEFDDVVQGRFRQNIAMECGDFVIRRRDALFAYQLAVVVDDDMQGITEVVRGADLLDSTPRQIYLYQKLGLTTPGYAHIPLCLLPDGEKYSKSKQTPSMAGKKPVAMLCRAMQHLGHQPPAKLCDAEITDFWQWAVSNWSIERVPSQQGITLRGAQ